MSIDTSDRPEAHVNRCVKRRSGAVSLRRVNSISNGPDVVEQRDASATRTPLHVLLHAARLGNANVAQRQNRLAELIGDGLHRAEHDEAARQHNRWVRGTHVMGLFRLPTGRPRELIGVDAVVGAALGRG